MTDFEPLMAPDLLTNPILLVSLCDWIFLPALCYGEDVGRHCCYVKDAKDNAQIARVISAEIGKLYIGPNFAASG
ncbi:unnamed protein product [Heligmosomoides polygyrus]|uniref:Oxidoreductase n=1 Tax=Heligmosomoides polygyrus TaxID=6339 RepID=A0A183G875_HELPZ|nr:unnamed protein product [Heligmosomoides polygyrus]